MAVRRSGAFLSITVDSHRVEEMIKGLERAIPEGAKLGARGIASIYAQIYLEQLGIAGIERWTGRSFNILRQQMKNPERIGNGYGVLVPSTLIALDDLKQPHIVALKPGRSITRWAKAKGFKGTHISVKRHPWVNAANRRARKRVTMIIKKEMDKKVRGKGKR